MEGGIIGSHNPSCGNRRNSRAGRGNGGNQQLAKHFTATDAKVAKGNAF
jgi:hypothetical protein